MATYSENLIPIMTSATTPIGTVIFSNNGGSGYDVWRAFDKNITSYYAVGYTTIYIGYTFTSSKCVSKYTISPSSGQALNKCPKNWTFEGSNDGINWTVLDTQTNITDWVNGVKKEFLTNNSSSFTSYKLNISNINGGTGIGIGEIEMMEKIFQNKYLIQDKNSILRTIDVGGNLIDSPSQILDESNYLTNGFNDVTHIPVDQLKALGNLSDFKLLMYTDDTSKNEVKLVGECDPFDLTEWMRNNQCKLNMWTDDTTKTEATMEYELLTPYRPIDILKKNNGGVANVLIKEV